MPAKCAAPRATAHLSQEYRTPAWEQRKLGELIQLGGSGGTPSATNPSYYGGEIPFLSIADIEGRDITHTAKTLTEEGLKNSAAWIVPAGAVSLAMYASVGKVGIIRQNTATSQAFYNMVFDNAAIRDFVFTRLEKADMDSEWEPYISTGTQRNLNADKVKAFALLIPEVNEAANISRYFRQLDSLITLHQRKYDKLCVLKKSMLDKMFPKGGSLYPEIRFAGFTDPWEQRKLGELYQKNDERNTDGLGSERTLSVASMTFNSTGNGADESSLPSYKRLRLGDIAFEGHANKEFAYGRFVLNDAGNGIMSPRFTCLRPIAEQEYSFWKYFIHSEEVMRPILVNSTKSGTMMNELVVKDFLEQEILVPSLPEQRRIGAFFDRLDSLITLHQRKLELLRNIKKSMLDKMFV